MEAIHPSLQRWYDFVREHDPVILNEVLADDVVFLSPVVHTPQRGKKITFMYLSAAYAMFSGEAADSPFTYVNEIVQDGRFSLEFECQLDGIYINGVDLIELNAEGKISQFKVMLRPLQAVHKVQEMMATLLTSWKNQGSQ